MQIKTIDFQRNKTLSIVQFCSEQVDSFEYVSVGYAINNKMIEIKEISDSGSVNNIFVLNKSDKFVFFMDGDVLIGAKQNRVLNTSILIEPQTKTNIPVSCVEAGRWRYRSSIFRDSDFVAPTNLRASKAKDVNKSLKMEKGFYADQSKVWSIVLYSASSSDVYSETSDLSDVFEKKKDYFEEFLKGFKVNNQANGLAIFLRKKLLSIDLFNRRDIYAEYFPKIIKGTAAEAYNLKEDKNNITDKEVNYKLIDFFDKYDAVDKEIHKSIGVGNEKRFDNNYITGFELEFMGNTIHLAAIQLQEKLT